MKLLKSKKVLSAIIGVLVAISALVTTITEPVGEEITEISSEVIE